MIDLIKVIRIKITMKGNLITWMEYLTKEDYEIRSTKKAIINYDYGFNFIKVLMFYNLRNFNPYIFLNKTYILETLPEPHWVVIAHFVPFFNVIISVAEVKYLAGFL